MYVESHVCREACLVRGLCVDSDAFERDDC